MICVPASSIYEKAARMPVAYISDCKAVAQIRTADQFWCFKPSDFFRIRQKYRGYAVSEVVVEEKQRIQEGEIISGCCDRADQY
jgi:hypothetical protein